MSTTAEAAEARADLEVPNGASVRVERGFYQGLELAIDRSWMVIGRGRGADLLIADPTISRAHAAIGFEDGGFFVQDMGSTNGTRVNGERKKRAPLVDSDQLLLGKLLLRVSLPQGGSTR